MLNTSCCKLHVRSAETMNFIEFQFDTDLRHKKSFIIDLELDIITQEIDSKLEMNTTSHKNVTGFIFHFHGISKPWDKFLTWLLVISSILSLSVLLFYVLFNFLLPNSIHHFLLLKTKICLFLHARAIVFVSRHNEILWRQ